MNARARWQKSTFSGADDNQDCLELAAAPGATLLRESDAPKTVIAAAHVEVRALITRIKEGALQ
ncbi:DUF397 domain-containing protein [Streptomyces sp. L500]|uniref:DUF397 domain-containing protein n=1 Tax=Streptomyces abikoensis TaxID=97398 RepID=UPI0036A264DA